MVPAMRRIVGTRGLTWSFSTIAVAAAVAERIRCHFRRLYRFLLASILLLTLPLTLVLLQSLLLLLLLLLLLPVLLCPLLLTPIFYCHCRCVPVHRLRLRRRSRLRPFFPAGLPLQPVESKKKQNCTPNPMLPPTTTSQRS